MNFLTRDTTFLCVDDEDHFREEVVTCLRNLKFTGQIYTATSAVEALRNYEAGKYEGVQVIISDMVMPELEGCDFVKKMRSFEELKKTPMLMLTSISTKEVILECVESGADNYIIKPVDKERLASKLVSAWHKYQN